LAVGCWLLAVFPFGIGQKSDGVELASQVLGYFNLAVPVQKLRAAKLAGIFWLSTEEILKFPEFIFYYISFDFLFFRLRAV
jgi:hypothetical protein